MPAGAADNDHVGTVTGLWRYPVKSMAAEAVDEVQAGWHGLDGDRRWAFVRAGSASHSFPWHTIREDPQLVLYRPRLTEPGRADHSGVQVNCPDDLTYDIEDPELAARMGSGVRLIRLATGTFDVMPISLISTSTVAAVCRNAEVPADAQRFRPNLLVDTGDAPPFVEESWVGCEVRIGNVVLRVDQPDDRCTIVNVDPASGVITADVLKTVGRLNNARAGVYGSVVEPGRLRSGGVVELSGGRRHR